MKIIPNKKTPAINQSGGKPKPNHENKQLSFYKPYENSN